MADICKRLDMQALVDRLASDCFEAHRGSFWWDEKRRIAIAFGNDGYREDRRARLEVEAVRRLLAHWGGKELGFATESEFGYSWALACEVTSKVTPDIVEGVLWRAWDDLSTQKEEGKKLGLDEAACHERLTLNWDEIAGWLAGQRFPSAEACFTGLQANIARATLERNGLL
jgi:hypothetical protein